MMALNSESVEDMHRTALMLGLPVWKQRRMGSIICLAAKDGEMMDPSSLIYGQDINMI